MKKNNSKKTLENPIMVEKENKKQKNIKIKGSQVSTGEDENEVKTFIIILVIIVVIVGGIYALTEYFKKDDKKEENTNTVEKGSINYEKLSVGMLLNRPYDDYYVLVYDSKDDDAILYSTIMSKYMQKSSEKDYIKIYFCDLNNALNKPYHDVNKDGKSNPKATKIEDLDFGKVTLLKISKGKITNYLEDFEKIKSELK